MEYENYLVIDEYKNYCIYSKAKKMRKFSECDLKTIVMNLISILEVNIKLELICSNADGRNEYNIYVERMVVS